LVGFEFRDDPELGQRVVAFVGLATGMQSKICAQILADVAPHLADYKMPERLQIVDTISRNARHLDMPRQPQEPAPERPNGAAG
jgi:hypothetical protein